MDKEALKEVLTKKRLEPVARRAEVHVLITQFGMSERRACRLMEMDRTSYRDQGDATDRDQPLLRDRLGELARHRPR